MPRIGSTSSILAFDANQLVYLVVDRFDARGSTTEVRRPDLETTISDLMEGQFNDPVRILAFNRHEDTSEDVSKQVAEEIQARCDIDAAPVPEHLRDFVENHTRRMPTAFTLHRDTGEAQERVLI
jgi:hypothetical protein